MKRSIFILLFVFLFSSVSIVSIAAGDDNYAKGLFFYKKGDFKSSIKYLTAYIEKSPDPRAYYLIGYASYELKNYPTSQKYFKDAYLIDPAFKPALIDME